MFLDTSFEGITEALQDLHLVRRDEVVPADFPPVGHSPYRPEYGWLFTYERRLARFLKDWTEQHRLDLIGPRGLISEALSNAYCHGNRRNTTTPISVRVFVGQNGLLLQIIDTGEGFSIQQVLHQAARGRGGYFHNAGHGMRNMMTHEKFGIFYGGTGNTFHLVYFFENPAKSLQPFALEAPGQHSSPAMG